MSLMHLGQGSMGTGVHGQQPHSWTMSHTGNNSAVSHLHSSDVCPKCMSAGVPQLIVVASRFFILPQCSGKAAK